MRLKFSFIFINIYKAYVQVQFWVKMVNEHFKRKQPVCFVHSADAEPQQTRKELFEREWD